MKATVLQQLHNNAGHLGLRKTTESIKEQFYQLAYELGIEKWVQECKQFQQCNAPQPKLQVPLETFKATCPIEKIFWDIMGPLPTSSKGKKYILVVTDIFNKWVEPFAFQSTETMATVLVNKIVC